MSHEHQTIHFSVLYKNNYMFTHSNCKGFPYSFVCKVRALFLISVNCVPLPRFFAFALLTVFQIDWVISDILPGLLTLFLLK